VKAPLFSSNQPIRLEDHLTILRPNFLSIAVQSKAIERFPMPKRIKSDKKKRPVAISIIAVAIATLFLIRLYEVFDPLARNGVLRNGITAPLLQGWRLTLLGSAMLSSATYLVLSLAGIIVLVGFLRLKRWSWVLLMAWTGASLVISLVDYFYARPNYIVMASNVIIAFALNMTDVQLIFGIRRDNDSAL
jgi:hypothetical protein